MLQLAFYFAVLSLVSVGGIPSVMPELQRLVVEVEGWMSSAEFTRMFALAQAAPGPNVLVTALLGWKVFGIPGAFVGLAAFCTPAAALAWGIGGYWDRMREAPWRKTFQRALLPITTGFILSGGYVLATPQGLEWRSALIAAASAAFVAGTRFNPLWVLAASGFAGALLF